MFDLEEYKEDLINYYRYEIDNTEEKRDERRRKLQNKDEYLTKIMHDTEEFIYYLLTRMKRENNIFDNSIFLNLETEEDNYPYYEKIDFNLSGGWPSDIFFYFGDKTKLISRRLLRKFLENFRIEDSVDDVERFDEEDEVGWVDSYFYLDFSANIKDFNIAYEKARNLKGQELTRVLKKIGEK